MLMRVAAFGAFDPLHAGHCNYFKQARRLGDELTVVVARDSSIRTCKHREPYKLQRDRLDDVARSEYVDYAVLGGEYSQRYDVFDTIRFDIVVLGYDQMPSNDAVRAELCKRGRCDVKVVRLLSYMPHLYKSSYMRSLQHGMIVV